MFRRLSLFGVLVALSALTYANASERLTGLRTFDIGPGWPDTFETVPWGDLISGDVVNIHYRPEPYLYKLGLRAKGTTAYPVIINGVTGPYGERPILNFQGARTAPGSLSVFNTSAPEFNESLGGIVIKRGPGEPWEGPKPSHIQIKNLVLRNAKGSYTSLAGNTVNHGVTACIYVLVAQDLLVENSVMYGCGFGIFTMAKEGKLAHACERLTLRNSQVYNNGRANSWLEHNAYIQCASPVIEGNYFGKLITNAQGSSFKDRSSNLVFRNNYVISASRALDLVHSEDQDIDGIATLPDYGRDLVEGNTLMVDTSTAIHYGGDNYCEQESGSTLCVPPVNYRFHLTFRNNTVIYSTSGWRNSIFDLSLRDTRVDAYNNRFHLGTQATNHHMVEYAGRVNFWNNLVIGSLQFNGRDGYDPSMVTINLNPPQ
jgi:hypothetical protein